MLPTKLDCTQTNKTRVDNHLRGW